VVALVGLLLLGQVAFTADDTKQAIHDAAVNTGVPASRLWRIVACETGSTFSPYAVGDRGQSIGAVQLHVRGERKRFYQYGYSDPYNPYEAVEFLALRILAGGASAWTCR
jgi:hypothetical protein